MKFDGGVWDGKWNKWLGFGSNPDHYADCSIGNKAITQQIVKGVWWNCQDSSAKLQGALD